MLSLYSVVDEYDGLIKIGVSKNDISFIRSNVAFVASTRPLKDVKVKRVGIVDEDTGIVTPVEPSEIPWSIYSLPRDVEDSLAPLGEDAVKAYSEAVKASKDKSINN